MLVVCAKPELYGRVFCFGFCFKPEIGLIELTDCLNELESH